MDPISLALLAAGAAVKGIVGIGKAISGGIQKRKAQKVLDSETPKYSRPDEYSKILSIFQQQAGLSELPGQSQTEEKLSAATARGTRAIGKYADSSVAAVAASAGLYGREQGAIRDLGIQFAQFKNKTQGQLADAYKMGADYSDKEWSYNNWYPDQMKRNMAAQQWNGGQQNLWGGIDQAAAAGMDFASSYADAKNAKNGNPFGPGAPSTGWGIQNLAAVGSSNPTDAYGYYNPNLAGQFVPSFGTQAPATQPGSDWGQWGSWAPK